MRLRDGRKRACTHREDHDDRSRGDCEEGIANTASITADDDVDLTNNESSAHISVLCPNPGVVKTAEVDPIVFGDPASFTIVVSAGGSGDATNVVLTDENTSNTPGPSPARMPARATRKAWRRARP